MPRWDERLKQLNEISNPRHHPGRHEGDMTSHGPRAAMSAAGTFLHCAHWTPREALSAAATAGVALGGNGDSRIGRPDEDTHVGPR
jgi:hypothetical protein